MNYQIITVSDLHDIVCKKHHVSVILEKIAKFHDCTVKELIASNTKKYIRRGGLVFTLRYFGITYETITEVTGLNSLLISESYRAIKETYFKDPKTIELFLFVLNELRK